MDIVTKILHSMPEPILIVNRKEKLYSNNLFDLLFDDEWRQFKTSDGEPIDLSEMHGDECIIKHDDSFYSLSQVRCDFVAKRAVLCILKDTTSIFKV